MLFYHHHCLISHSSLVEKATLVKESCPWYDSFISHMRDMRRKAERSWKRRRADSSRQDYIDALFRVTSEIESKEKVYLDTKIKSCFGNSGIYLR